MYTCIVILKPDFNVEFDFLFPLIEMNTFFGKNSELFKKIEDCKEKQSIVHKLFDVKSRRDILYLLFKLFDSNPDTPENWLINVNDLSKKIGISYTNTKVQVAYLERIGVAQGKVDGTSKFLSLNPAIIENLKQTDGSDHMFGTEYSSNITEDEYVLRMAIRKYLLEYEFKLQSEWEANLNLLKKAYFLHLRKVLK